MTDLIQVKDDNAVRLIRINRPDKKNALNPPMYHALAQAVGGASLANVRCIVIAGVPGAFCAGNDLEDFRKAATEHEGLNEHAVSFLHALARCRTPLVAAVQGVAVGIGTTMLLHCDYVVAGTDARFSTPFVQLGLVPEAASSLLAPRLMGQRRAFALLVMGQPLDAAAAKECGLVNEIVSPQEVDGKALDAARRIAALPPEAVALTRALTRGDPDAVGARIDEEVDLFRARLQTPEAQAAFAAFFARKK